MFGLKKIMAATAGAVFLFALTPATESHAATCKFGTEADFTALADVWTSTACVGQIDGNDSIGNDSGSNVDLNNPSNFGGIALFGSTDWSLDTRIERNGSDFSAANPAGILSASFGNDLLSGSWSVTSWTGVDKAMLVLKGGNGFAAYLLNLAAGTSGEWVTQALTNNGGQQPALSHVSLYTSPVPIPLPAAGILLLSALGGLGIAARRRRKEA